MMKSSKGGYIVLTALFAMLLCFYSGNNLFSWISAKKEISRQEKLARQYQDEIVTMHETIRSLTSDKDTLEKYARENFHFARENEDVYLIDE